VGFAVPGAEPGDSALIIRFLQNHNRGIADHQPCVPSPRITMDSITLILTNTTLVPFDHSSA
jgi:hypothetical protein